MSNSRAAELVSSDLVGGFAHPGPGLVMGWSGAGAPGVPSSRRATPDRDVPVRAGGVLFGDECRGSRDVRHISRGAPRVSGDKRCGCGTFRHIWPGWRVGARRARERDETPRDRGFVDARGRSARSAPTNQRGRVWSGAHEVSAHRRQPVIIAPSPDRVAGVNRECVSTGGEGRPEGVPLTHARSVWSAVTRSDSCGRRQQGTAARRPRPGRG